MIVVQNRLFVTKGWEKEFEKRFVDREWTIDRLPGFIRNEVLKPNKDTPDAPYVVKTYWETYEGWTKSPEFHKAHANPPPKEAFSGPNQLEIHEVISVHEKPVAD